MLTQEQKENFFVSHLSPSAIRQYLTDPQMFFKRYIRLEFDEPVGASMIEGTIAHEVLEYFYENIKEGKRIEDNDVLEYFENVFDRHAESGSFAEVDFGTSGSVDKSKKTVRAAIEFYLNEKDEIMRDIQEIISTEHKMITEFSDLEGNKMPVPLKGVTDLIYIDDKGALVVEDHKLVGKFSQQGENVAYEIAAGLYWFLARAEFGKNPDKMIFREIKKSKNRDGSPQTQAYEIKFDTKLINRVLELYKRIVKQLAGQPLIDHETGTMQFLPNPYGMFGAKESWEDFCAEVDGERSFTLSDVKSIKSQKGGEDNAIDL